MEPLVGRTPSRDNLEGGRHSMLSALPPPPVPLGVPYFNQPPLSNGPYGHLAPLARKPDTPPLQPLPPPAPRQPGLDATRSPLDMARAPSPLPLEPVRAPSPLPQPEVQRRMVQTYRKRQHDANAARPFDFGASHVAGMLVRPDGDIPNLPPRSGTGVRLRPARLPACSCIPPPQPEPLVPVDPMLLQVLRMHDQRRMVNPGQVANVVVFDCIERPPRSSAEPVPGGGAGCGGGGAGSGGEAARSGEAQAGGGGGGAGRSEGSKRASSASGAGAGSSGQGGRISGEGGGGGQRRGSEPESAAVGPLPPRGGSGSGEAAAAAAGGGGGGGDGADATSGRGAAGPPSCSYSRTSAYDYFEDMPAWYCLRGPSDHTLVFESRYESGNLRRAIQVYPYEYDLILRPDINTRGHTQWFFFSIANTRAGCRYKFNIINLLKEDSLYNDGMQPLVHSAKTQAGRGLGWHRAGSRICYYANAIRRGRSGKTYFTLTFTLSTEYDNDLVHVAHCYPYTYTDLQRHIRSLELDPLRRTQLRRETLATSLAGNSVDLLTITSPTDDADALRRRKAVVVSARVHPGESNASWMMKGLLDFLMGPSLDARILRDTFVFKVIPMLNPDGVITGNYRCSLAGVDLNRVWNDPSRKLHPAIHATKLFLKQLADEREVALFCDLHGHSRKRGVFMYGCEKKLPRDATPVFPSWPLPGSLGGQANIPHRFQEKLLPLLVQYNAPDSFSYQNCSFKVQKSKGGTSRVVGFRELGLVNSFTVEASFAGPSSGRWARQHFNTSHLEQQGAALVTALLDYWDPEAYGYGDLLGQLDFLHPSNGEAPPRFITTPDGQLVEVEDDEPPTDSDDESSDDGGGGGARGRARTAGSSRGGAQLPAGPLSRDAPGSAFMQQYYNTYGMSPGAAAVAAATGLLAAANGLPPDLGGGLGSRAQLLRPQGDKGLSDSEAVMDPKKAKRRARLAMQKALLRAEQAKATEGLAACLPMMAALQVQSPTGAFGSTGDAAAAAALDGVGGPVGRTFGGGEQGYDPGSGGGGSGRGAGSYNGMVAHGSSSSAAAAGAGYGPGFGSRSHGAVRGLSAAATPHAIEYAKQRGVYRGDAPQWTVPGLNAVYDLPDSAMSSSPPSPSPVSQQQQYPHQHQHHHYQHHRPQSPSRAGAGRLAATSSNAFNALLLSQASAGGAGGGGGGGSLSNGMYFGGGGVGPPGGGVGSHMAGFLSGGGGGVVGGLGRPGSPGLALTHSGRSLAVRPPPYVLPSFGSGGTAGSALAAAAAASPVLPPSLLSPQPGRDDGAHMLLSPSNSAAASLLAALNAANATAATAAALDAASTAAATAAGTSSPAGANYSRSLHRISSFTSRSSAPRPLSSRASAIEPAAAAAAAATAAGGGGALLRAPSAASRPPALVAALEMVEPAAGGAGGDDGHEDAMGSPLRVMAAAFLDPERLRRDREALEQRVTETVLTTSPLFQRL